MNYLLYAIASGVTAEMQHQWLDEKYGKCQWNRCQVAQNQCTEQPCQNRQHFLQGTERNAP